MRLLEKFSKDHGSDNGVPSTIVGVNVVQQEASFEHQLGTQVAEVSWTSDSPQIRYFQVNFGSGQDFSSYRAMSFRTALKCFTAICNRMATQMGEMSYTVSLVDVYGQVSNPYSTVDHVRLSRPIGDTRDNFRSTLYSVEIPFVGLS